MCIKYDKNKCYLYFFFAEFFRLVVETQGSKSILRKKFISPNQFETMFVQPTMWWLKRIFMCSFSYITFLMSGVTCLSNTYEAKSLVSQLVCSSLCFQHIQDSNPSFPYITIKLFKKIIIHMGSLYELSCSEFEKIGPNQFRTKLCPNSNYYNWDWTLYSTLLAILFSFV